jgi:hypothetical protein
MSYDLTFSDPRRDPAAVTSDTAPAADVWRRVVERVRTRLDSVEASLNDAYGDLTDEATGIHLQLTARTARISLAYWHFEQPADAITILYELAGIVERETGLVGADPRHVSAGGRAAPGPGRIGIRKRRRDVRASRPHRGARRGASG